MQSTLFGRNDDLWNFFLMYRNWPNTEEQNEVSLSPEKFSNIVAKLVNRTSIVCQILIWPKEWKGKEYKSNTSLGFAKLHLSKSLEEKLKVTNTSLLCFLQQQRMLFCVKRFVERKQNSRWLLRSLEKFFFWNNRINSLSESHLSAPAEFWESIWNFR